THFIYTCLTVCAARTRNNRSINAVMSGCARRFGKGWRMGRFILYAFMAFTTAFVGFSWAARGFPTRASAPQLVAPLRPTLDSSFGDENAKARARKDWVSEHTAQSDKNPKLDALRMAALQAGNAYSLSPCDRTMKSNLIEALTAYTRAWQAMRGCTR